MIEWTAELSVGIQEFDGHHQRIVGLINKLEASLAGGNPRQTAVEVATELANYTLYHFSAEEEAMEQCSFPGLPEHRKEHIDLTARTLELLHDAYKGKQNIDREILEFLIQWLRHHIQVVDKAYSSCLQGCAGLMGR